MVAHAIKSEPMTVAQFMALPPERDGVTRELINGRIRERDVTTRNRWHCSTESLIAYLLHNWQKRTGAKGVVASGEVRCRLSTSSATVVGIDVAFFGPEHIGQVDEETDGFAGPPILAVEILSPSDTQESVAEKIRVYLEAGVRQVWMVDTEFHTITVHRKGFDPCLFGSSQTITGEPDLPGFSEPVSSFFLPGHARG